MEDPVPHCQIHHLRCLGVDSNPLCEAENRHCCELCLNNAKQSREFVTYEKAQECLAKVKNEFLSLREKQCTYNIETLKKVSNEIVQLQKKIENIFVVQLEEVGKQIVFIQTQFDQIEKQYGGLNLDQYFNSKFDEMQQLNFSIFIQNLEIGLQKIIQKSNLETIFSNLKQLDDKLISIGRICPPNYINEQSEKTQKLSLKCLNHKKDVKVFDINNQLPINERVLCEECLDERIGPFTSFTKIQDMWKEYESFNIKAIQLGNNLSQKKDKLLQSLEQLKVSISKEVENIIHNINLKYLSLSEKNREDLKVIQKQWMTLMPDEILDRIQILSKKSLKDIVFQQYTNQFVNLSKDLFESVNSLQQTLAQISNQFVLELTNDRNQFGSERIEFDGEAQEPPTVPVNFQLVNSDNEMRTDDCQALAINSGQNTVVAACKKQIKIFQFENAKLTEKQVLNGHTENIGAIIFLEKSDCFVSAGLHIIIWQKIHDKWMEQWSKIQAHSRTVKCLLSYNDDNEIASCGRDGYVRIWKRIQTGWAIKQELKQSQTQHYSMSLNLSKQQLVVCGYADDFSFYGGKIIFYRLHNQMWEFAQVSKFTDFINYISFPGEDNLIVFSQQLNLQVMEYSEQNNCYVIQQLKSIRLGKIYYDSDCDDSFHQIYNQKQKFLIKRQGSRLYILKNLSNGQFHQVQEIDFPQNKIFGSLTKDGRFLITWDNNSCKFQVRKQE